jgi:hypothetical protein
MRRSSALAALVASFSLFVPSAVRATPYTLYGEYPAIHGNFNPNVVTAENMWTGKTAAVVNMYTAQGALNIGNQLINVWTNLHAIPLISVGACQQAAEICNALDDQFVSTLTTFLEGPNGTIGDADDRRAYLRYGYEPNVHAWGPCQPGNSFTQYKSLWTGLHDKFSAAGVTNTRLAWVYSVASGNAPLDENSPCAPGTDIVKLAYPGSAYVDWLGVDAYAWCAGNFTTAADPMITHLRNDVDATKPMSIDEAGTSSYRGVASKNAFIADYWNYIATHDVRMAVWSNVDNDSTPLPQCNPDETTQPWAVFNTTYGDESSGNLWHGFSAYRVGVSGATVVSATGGGARYVTDARFLGQ